MPVRISVLDQIKKLMGWCPNSKVHETRQHVNLGNFDSNISDRARGENNGLKSLGWLRKMSTYILLIDICFTLGFPDNWSPGCKPGLLTCWVFYCPVIHYTYLERSNKEV